MRAAMKIEEIHAREILDSRGNPTVEVDVRTTGGFGRASVPSGASTGSNEALELRDKDKRFQGKGVRRAVENVNRKIAPALLGLDASNQTELDQIMLELDGTPNKTRLGANAILGVSLAVARAAADTLGLPLYRYLGGVTATQLPVPTLNVLNGGKHAGNNLAIQEFMIQPRGAKNFGEGLQMAAETYHILGELLKKKYGQNAVNVGYEGGYAPPLERTHQALDCITRAVEEAGYADEITLGIDAAASEFYTEGKYEIDGDSLLPGEMIDFYTELTRTYNILLIEDPFEEESFEEFAELTRKLSNKIIVGDDIFVTNIDRLREGINIGAANALLLKVNQIGSLTEALEAGILAHRNRYRVVVSHRSAETEDTTIADIAVALGADLIKTGAPARSERTAKYNQLLRIEEELKNTASYATI